jgi:hypothetical protein
MLIVVVAVDTVLGVVVGVALVAVVLAVGVSIYFCMVAALCV